MTAPTEQTDTLWTRLAAPVPASEVQWRQQGKARQFDGKMKAQFVAYIDAQFVRARLDEAAEGEWSLELTHLPAAVTGEGEEIEPFAFKATLTVGRVMRECVGTGKDYKTAATDAFKRAAVRFGIGHELYTDYPLIWVEVDGDGKYAKAVQDPAAVFAAKGGKAAAASRAADDSKASGRAATGGPAGQGTTHVSGGASRSSEPANAGAGQSSAPAPLCPKCEGPMWDNRVGKRNPKAPDFKCKDKACDGAIWPPKDGKPSAPASAAPSGYNDAEYVGALPPSWEEADGLPF